MGARGLREREREGGRENDAFGVADFPHLSSLSLSVVWRVFSETKVPWMVDGQLTSMAYRGWWVLKTLLDFHR